MANNGFIKKLWTWFDNYFLLIATAFLAVFIPLYPKIPLPVPDLLPGYIVRLRLEDVFIVIVAVWWGIQALRRKVDWRNPLTWSIVAYVICGLLANIFGVLVTKTIPAETLHIGKSMLHWARYGQYFSLFFIAYSAIKTKRQAFIFTGILLATVLAVAFYGYGQKSWYWPVYSTMNREFSKGIRLYLGPYARVQSTFAGHYDLGAYLVVIVPLALALFFGLGKWSAKNLTWIKERWVKLLRIMALLVWFSGLWLLVMSASRASFGGYLVAAGLVFLFLLPKRGLLWFLSRGFLVFLVSGIMLVFVGDLSTRFAQLIDQNKYPEIHSAYHTVNDLIQHPRKLIGLAPSQSQPPEGAKSVEQLEQELNEAGLTMSDTQPSTVRPSDVQVDVPLEEYDINDPAATLAAGLIEKDGKLVRERIYSDCSLQQSLSVCIRLETLWPRAIAGFTRNPLFGSGYATLTKETVGQFTEAESTDNNFLRTLGETGALGFFFFYGSIGLAMWYEWLAYRRSDDPFIRALAIGGFAGAVGLLINATYIDVFAASKVAYTFWLVQGLILAVLVKEGVVAPHLAFERQNQKQKTAELSSLLQKVEEQVQAKEGKSGYISSAKRRQKSMKRKKSVRK